MTQGWHLPRMCLGLCLACIKSDPGRGEHWSPSRKPGAWLGTQEGGINLPTSQMVNLVLAPINGNQVLVAGGEVANSNSLPAR